MLEAVGTVVCLILAGIAAGVIGLVLACWMDDYRIKRRFRKRWPK